MALAIICACWSPALASKNTLFFSLSDRLPNSCVIACAAPLPSISPLLKSCITPLKLSARLGNTVINPNAASLNPIAPMLAASRTAAPISPPASPPAALMADRKSETPVVNWALVSAGNLIMLAINI